MKSNKKFTNFRNKYLIDTNPLLPKDISNINDKYDVFITGSDQIFNPKLTGFDKNYFLDFVKDKNKCFSYAASFGLNFENLADEEKIFIKNNLKNFNILSLREKQGSNIVNKLSAIKNDVHLDPSLLLNKYDWLKLSKRPKENNFALLYLVDNNEKFINFAYGLSNSKKIKLVRLTNCIKKRMKAKYIYPSPEEWLGYFINAKYIITNSFHGLAFSINFNKQFFVDFVSSNKRNSRLEDLLDLTNLKDRLIDNIGTDYDKPIDWESVNKIIEKEREKSLNYLKKIIK